VSRERRIQKMVDIQNNVTMHTVDFRKENKFKKRIAAILIISDSPRRAFVKCNRRTAVSNRLYHIPLRTVQQAGRPNDFVACKIASLENRDWCDSNFAFAIIFEALKIRNTLSRNR
jgi:hypothetical protein